MSARPPLVEAATLGALAVATYSGVSVAVAAFGDGAKLSFWPVLAVVLLSYGLARLLGRDAAVSEVKPPLIQCMVDVLGFDGARGVSAPTQAV